MAVYLSILNRYSKENCSDSENNSFKVYNEKFDKLWHLALSINYYIKENETINEGFKSFIICKVITLEQFIRNKIINSQFPIKNQRELLSEQVPFWRIQSLLKNKDLSTLEIVANCHSFQNLSSINYVLSILFNEDFCEEIGKVQYDLGFVSDFSDEKVISSLNSDFSDWKKDLNSLFELNYELNNNISKNHSIDIDELKHKFNICCLFLIVLDIYFRKHS